MKISAGDLLTGDSAYGRPVLLRAVSGVEQGVDFPVVWVTKEVPGVKDSEAVPIPWPVDDLRDRGGEDE